MSGERADPGLPDGDLDLDDFTTDETTGYNSYTFSDSIKNKLKEIGLEGYSSRPALAQEHNGIFPDLQEGDYFNGRLPVVIRRLDLDQISALYSLFTSWYAYLTFQTNLIKAERSEALAQKEFLWSHVRKQYKFYRDHDGKTKKRSDQQMSDMARGDYRFVQANARYLEINTLYDCMNATLEVVEEDMKTVSREITIVQTKLKHDLGSSSGGRLYKPRNPEGSRDAKTSNPKARPAATSSRVAKPNRGRIRTVRGRRA
jgi:hypothetical protein